MKVPWPDVALAELLVQEKTYISEPESRPYPKLSVKLYGRGVKPDEPADGSQLKMKRHQLAKGGQVILSEIWGKKGAIGIVPPEGEGALCTSHFFLFDVCQDRVSPRWLHWIFRANYLEPQLGIVAKGSTGYAAVRPKHLLEARVPLPPPSEQRRLIPLLDALTVRLEEAHRLHDELAQEQHEFLLSRARELAEGTPRQPMNQVAPLVRRAVEIKPGASYAELGIRSFGKGTFHKPALTAEEVGSKRLFSIHPGDLLFSNVFSWEGAIAVSQPEDEGRFGSHRFITCVPDPAKATAEFLCHWFLTDEGMTHIRAASPGAAGRNRTLGIKKLMAIPVPLPPLAKQQDFSALRRQILAARALHKDLPAELDALQAALLDQAFRGEL